MMDRNIALEEMRAEMGMKLSDKFTISGQYKRRTFKQWLFRKPRELQTYIVTEVAESHSEYKESS